MNPPKASPTKTTPSRAAASIRARGAILVRCTWNPPGATNSSRTPLAVMGTPMVPAGCVLATRSATTARASSSDTRSPLSSTRNSFSAPVSSMNPRSAPRIRTISQSCFSDRWNSSAVLVMRVSSM